MRKKVLDFFGFIICVAVVLGIVSVIALVGGSIMKIFGFRYESVGKIILFFLIFAIVGFPTEVFAQALPNALLSLDRISFFGCESFICFFRYYIYYNCNGNCGSFYEGCVSLIIIHICDCIFICNHVFR